MINFILINYLNTRFKRLFKYFFNIIFVVFCVILLLVWTIAYPLLRLRYKKNKNLFQHPSYILFVWYKKLQKKLTK